jgi:hypothetical protein
MEIGEVKIRTTNLKFFANVKRLAYIADMYTSGTSLKLWVGKAGSPGFKNQALSLSAKIAYRFIFRLGF